MHILDSNLEKYTVYNKWHTLWNADPININKMEIRKPDIQNFLSI